MLSKKESNRITDALKTKTILPENNNIHFMGTLKKFRSKVLCRVKVNQEKRYVLNKKCNIYTTDVDIFNEYLQKQKDGIRGYKTIQIGTIEKYYYSGIVEFATQGCDIDSYYWWKCWENEVTVNDNIRKQINNYITNISSQFKRVKPV